MNTKWRGFFLLIVTATICRIASGQSVPPSPDRPWNFSAERQIQEAKALPISRLAIDVTKSYSLADLVDFAESNNPETRVAWEGAKERAAALRIAQSELYPVLAAVALSQVDRVDILFGNS